MKEATYYEKVDGKVKCLVCPHYCVLAEGKVGICRGRKNIDGKLYAVNYGETCSVALDPIEKKPLYHFYPGSNIFSVSPNGCNLSCPFCQNWEISQGKVPTQYIEPTELVELAKRYNSIGVAYTYAEPLVWYDYLLDVGEECYKHKLKNVLVTNGMINEDPLRKLLPLIDAMNIDLKSMDEKFYKEFVKGDLEAVLNTITIAKKSCHIELTNLLIPTKNDSDSDITKLVDWIAELGDDTPLHFSRYFPHYKFRVETTPEATLRKAWELAKKKLKYVYVGNIQIEGSSNTICPNCGTLLIERGWFASRITNLKGKNCGNCGYEINIVV